MSYLIVIVIAGLVGWIGGQYLAGSEHGPMYDIVAGAAGGIIAVALSRAVGPASQGWVMSVIVAVIGAFAALYGMRQFLKAKMAPVVTKRGRR